MYSKQTFKTTAAARCGTLRRTPSKVTGVSVGSISIALSARFARKRAEGVEGGMHNAQAWDSQATVEKRAVYSSTPRLSFMEEQTELRTMMPVSSTTSVFSTHRVAR